MPGVEGTALPPPSAASRSPGSAAWLGYRGARGPCDRGALFCHNELFRSLSPRGLCSSFLLLSVAFSTHPLLGLFVSKIALTKQIKGRTVGRIGVRDCICG